MKVVGALVLVGLLLTARSNIQLATNVRSFMSSRPPGKQTVTIIISCLQSLSYILQVVTDILHNVVIIYQCNILMLSIFLMARVIQPLPCSLVSLFTGAWQFVLLLGLGCWNFISLIQLSIIFEKTTFLDLESNKVLRFSLLYALIFAGGGLVIETNFVRLYHLTVSIYIQTH